MLDADVEVDRRDFRLRATLSVAPGERLALFGPSGAGKTTVLEAIAGLVPLRSGTVALNGRVLTSTTPPLAAVPPWQRRVGLLRQNPALFPHLSVRANLRYSRTAGRDTAELTALADTLGIGGLLPEMPARLSGGQAHRVALGRLLLARCDTLLLDEPYTGLDAQLRRTLTELVVQLVTERQIPAVLVAHELPDAQAFADRLAIIDGGRVLQDGSPVGVVRRPASRRVAELVGYRGFVPVRPRGTPGAAGGATARDTAARSTAADDLIVGIHPERIAAGSHPDRGIVLTGTVTGGRPSGPAWEVDLLVGTAQITGRLPERPAAEGGELVVTALDPPCFGPDGVAVPTTATGPDGMAGWPVQVSS